MADVDLFKMLDDGCLSGGKITLMAFIINTCERVMTAPDTTYLDANGTEHVMQAMSEEDGLKVTGLVSEYCRDSKDTVKLELLSRRIFEALCCPVPIYDNAAFMQIWGDILQFAFEYKDKLVFDELTRQGYFDVIP